MREREGWLHLPVHQIWIATMLAPEAALLLLLRLAAQCRERGGCAGAARGR